MHIKRIFSRLTMSSFAVAALIAGSLSADAKVYLSEDFDYATGNLYNGEGPWYRSGGNTANPIQVVANPLSYAGYQTEPVGNAVSTTRSQGSMSERLFVKFVEDPLTQGIKSGTVYYSALINVADATGIDGTGTAYFFGIAPGNSKGMVDGTGYLPVPRLFAVADGDGFNFGICKNSVSSAQKTGRLDYGTTYLVVCKYEFVDGSANDIYSVWVNPINNAEGTPDMSVSDKADISATYGAGGVVIYQGSSDNYTTPAVTIDAIRVADTWDELFGGVVTPPVTDAKIELSKTSVAGFTYPGLTYSTEITVKASGLTDDITVTSGSKFVTASPLTIPASDAMSASGAVVAIAYAPMSGSDNVESTVKFASSGVEAALDVKFSTMDITNAPNSTVFNSQPDSYDAILYTGKATVTFIEDATNRVYAQDMFGGVCFDFSWYPMPETLAVGDVITNVVAMMQRELNVPYGMVVNPAVDIVDHGKTKEPLEITAAELLADLPTYLHRLVRIKDVEFTPYDGQTFSGTVKGKQNGTELTVYPFAGTIGSVAVPAQATIVGIQRSASIVSVGPRSAADIIVPVAEPSLTVTPTIVFDGIAAPINVTTHVADIAVDAANLAKPADVYLTGANRADYALDAEQIAAGSSQTVIGVDFTPTVIGKRTARVNFDATPTELSTGLSLNFYAYDPDNMPTASVSPEALEPFTANVGETAQQTLTVTSANFIDYGTIKAQGNGNGAFVINSTMVLKSGNTNFTITFKPDAAGQYTESFVIESMMMEPITITVTGSAGGEIVDEKEGDELPLVTDNALKLLVEPFDGVQRNKPIAIDGWKNLALEGTRAFWGYDFDSNGAAKVTGYDSKVAAGESTPARMMLVTPALDFVNSASKMLTFRIMGENLAEGMTDMFEVCYIDVDDQGDMYVEPINGLNIPASSDYNGEWVDYVIDLEGNDLADTFFIGFRMTTARGRDNSAVYYVDDVTYGRTDVPFIRPAKLTDSIVATVGKDNQYKYSVTGQNLSGDIKLTVSGPNASRYTVAPATLPAEGGEFTVTFTSDEIGMHEGDIIFTSEGAPAAMMTIQVNNVEGLKAAFSASECEQVIYANGFDTDDEWNEWTLQQYNATNTWMQANTLGTLSSFTAINPESKSSLAIEYSFRTQDEHFISPDINIPAGAKVSFYSNFSGLYLSASYYVLDVIKEDGSRDNIFNSFYWAQENRHGDPSWIKFEFPLDAYVGQNVRFDFHYSGVDGEDQMIDDFKVTAAATDDDATVEIFEDGVVHFADLSTGNPVSWSWEFPGAEVETSTEQNPAVIYPAGGTYDVTLTVADADGNTSTVTRNAFVNVRVKALTAAIGLPAEGYLSPYAATHIPHMTEVTYVDLTQGKVASRNWTFTGADIATSDQQAVTVKYSEPGVYSVDLEVTNQAGTAHAYYEGINVGGLQNIWNVEMDETEDLTSVNLGWYGYYGGTNWMDMTKFGEYFIKPAVKSEIHGVDVFFSSIAHDDESADDPITVSLAKVGDDGMPGDIIAAKSILVKDLTDPLDDGYGYAPTSFDFDQPVEIDHDFFVTIGGFPNNYDDNICMYLTPRRADDGKCTTYHELEEYDDDYNPTGVYAWYRNDDEPRSFAISPRLNYLVDDSSVESVAVAGDIAINVNGRIITVNADRAVESVDIFNVAGANVAHVTDAASSVVIDASSLAPGIYVVNARTETSQSAVKVVLK